MIRKSVALKSLLLVGLIVLSHKITGASSPDRFDAALLNDWQVFRQEYGIDRFGIDGYFVRAARHGYGLVNRTYDFAWRFTRKTSADAQNSCGACHTPEDLAYAFVSSDRFDSKLNKRISFEERVMRCYVKRLDGFVPTIYDPAIRDIRIFARVVANNMGLTEGAYAKESLP